ncbi:hypothetical protein UFOVP1454_58 [uncultured Caudovirales phage]|uniref:Uncharacterized protein n=1 Tax=uncultured Caudovirales phage TaxID=2100421 RepID=A0A6J5SJL2_9CAUD|nr:hypothetical protein UFOVP1454_58 [uncultured Caudovirales phage]
MSNILSMLGSGLQSGLSGLGGFFTDVSAGMQDPLYMQKKADLQELGRIYSGDSIPAFARPGGAEPQTPESIRQVQLAQMAKIGSPLAVAALQNLSPLSMSDMQNREAEAKIAHLNAQAKFAGDTAGGGATGALVRMAMKDPEFRNTLYQIQTGDRQNLQRDAQGNITPALGAPEAKGALEKGKEFGGLQAKLELEPTIAAAVEQSKIGVTGTPANIEDDKQFAKDYQEYASSGGITGVVKNLKQLEEAHAALAKKSGLTGPIIGSVPDMLLAFAKPGAIDVREKVQEVAQRNLRLVLGGQFAQKEGEQLIARVYNDRLPESVNQQRISKLFIQIRDAARIKEDAGRYYKKNGSLRGWDGVLPTLSSFDPDNPTTEEILPTGGIVKPNSIKASEYFK